MNANNDRTYSTSGNEWPGLTPDLRQQLRVAEAAGASDADLLDLAMDACADAYGYTVRDGEDAAVFAWLGWSGARFANALKASQRKNLAIGEATARAVDAFDLHPPEDWPTLTGRYSAEGVPDHVLAFNIVCLAVKRGLLFPIGITWTVGDIRRWTGWQEQRAKTAFDGSCRVWKRSILSSYLTASSGRHR